MHGHCRLRSRGDGAPEFLRLKQAGLSIAVRQANLRARRPNGAHGGHTRVCNGHDFVPRSDPEREQHESDRIGARRYADHVAASEVTGKGPLERLDLRAEDIDPAASDTQQHRLNFGSECGVPPAQIEKRDHAGGHRAPSGREQ